VVGVGGNGVGVIIESRDVVTVESTGMSVEGDMDVVLWGTVEVDDGPVTDVHPSARIRMHSTVAQSAIGSPVETFSGFIAVYSTDYTIDWLA
jgi:hypothetical protein